MCCIKKFVTTFIWTTLFSLPYVLPCVTSEYLYFWNVLPTHPLDAQVRDPPSAWLSMCLLSCDLYKNLCVHLGTYMLLFVLFMHKHVISIPRYGFQIFVALVTLPFIFPTMFPQHVSIIRIPVNKPPLARSAYRFTPLGLM